MFFRGLKSNWRRAGVASSIQLLIKRYPELLRIKAVNPVEFSVEIVDFVWRQAGHRLENEFRHAGDWSTAAFCLAAYAYAEDDLKTYRYDTSMAFVIPALGQLFNQISIDQKAVVKNQADALAFSVASGLMDKLAEKMNDALGENGRNIIDGVMRSMERLGDG
jgi:hypothetical protein